MNVYKALSEARSRLHKVPLSKSGYNEYKNYKYFELGDFLPTAIEIFNELDLLGVVSYDKEQATLKIVLTADPTSFITITSPMAQVAPKSPNEMQSIGAIETYQRRYLWMTALEIVENDLLDHINGAPPESRPVPVKEIKEQFVNNGTVKQTVVDDGRDQIIVSIKKTLSALFEGYTPENKIKFMKVNFNISSFKEIEEMKIENLIELMDKLKRQENF